MYLIDDTVITSDISQEFFVCDLSKCKGACCIEGDLGAPLEEEELEIIDRIQADIEPYLSEIGKEEIKKQGTWVRDEDGDYSTPIIKGRECVYAIYDDKGYLKCAIEQAYLDGKVDFQKPISCHLYPIRVSKLAEFKAVNYERWSICSDACSHGKSLGVPLYKFLKTPLIRKFGEKWYEELEREIVNEL
ncbi:DUF3109 family protein [Sandaracinomonas limnophila]|uniref:DUF3109 family protein n=1 Tax=Sandaracinomonas limnophila TaxID=1862386 RepID=A0A437PW49_9BACT|nr:DUF3109 family protein [Sandaracinomonas limnophila]RVU26476.1 DUF3109 family protein [Sandaracinomonas limnophila]